MMNYSWKPIKTLEDIEELYEEYSDLILTELIMHSMSQQIPT